MKNVLIKTYCFESGLFYLAKSLSDSLIRNGCKVYFAPKSKYILDGRVFRRTYPSPKNSEEFKRQMILPFTVKKSITELINHAIVKYNIDTVISLETLMEKAQWIAAVKARHKVKIIDVPMVEWVNPNLLKNGSYNLFDEIWCLTDHTKDFFNNYPSAKRKSWEYVDKEIFYPGSKRNNKVMYYHAGSLNPDCSTKNTDKILSAFSQFCLDEKPEAELIFTGGLFEHSVKKHVNIQHINKVLNREKIGNIYREVDVVLAPSQKEGLGMSLFEAIACGCKIITTDAPPMNEIEADYLCKVSKFKRDRGLIPLAQVKEEEIYKQIKQSYEDIIDGKR